MDSRVGLAKFLKTWLWSIAYYPNFVAAKKNRKIGKTAVQKIDDALGEHFSPLHEDPVLSHHNLADLAISAADVFLQKLQRELAINAGAEPEHLQDLAITAGDVPEQALQPDLAIIARELPADEHALSAAADLGPVSLSERGDADLTSFPPPCRVGMSRIGSDQHIQGSVGSHISPRNWPL